MPIINETIKGQAREFLSLNGIPNTIINDIIKRSVLDCLSFPHRSIGTDMNHVFTMLIHGQLRMFRDNQKSIELKRKRLNKTLTCQIIKGNEIMEYEYCRP